MNTTPYQFALLFILLITQSDLNAQVNKRIREYNRRFQVSLFPGISTNGVGSGAYFNDYSVNLFGGFSAGNRVLELGLISNVNTKTSGGIQLAGLANVIGANAFLNLTLSEERELISDDFESNMKGIQFAGFLNYVRNHVKGIQIAGGLNVVGGDFKGFQLAGIGNSAGGTSAGVMLAGLYNLSKDSFGGFQISTLFNYTDFALSGLQLGLINKARMIKGKRSTPPVRSRGLQIGLINFSKEMDGLQIGLINFGGVFKGKQFGLINFYNKYGSKEYGRMGTPVGLLNFGLRGSHLRFYYDEIFTANMEFTTGNCLNCSYVMTSEMPYHDQNKIYNQNALILGFDPFQDTWGFGYGFQKILYNKFSVRPVIHNEKRMISYGIKFLHLNRTMSFDKTFNLVSRLNVEYGKRRGFTYLFAGVSLNYFVTEEVNGEEVYPIRSLRIPAGKLFDLASTFWPGYTIGVQML